MKLYQLEPEEEEILKAFEEGKLVRVKNFDEEKKSLEQAARNTLNKTRNINSDYQKGIYINSKLKLLERGFLTKHWLRLFSIKLPVSNEN